MKAYFNLLEAELILCQSSLKYQHLLNGVIYAYAHKFWDAGTQSFHTKLAMSKTELLHKSTLLFVTWKFKNTI